MRPRPASRVRFAALFILTALVGVPLAQAPRQPFSRVAITVTPDHPDWTYKPGEPVKFRVDVLITLQVGIHGVPVIQPQEAYDGLGRGGLSGYQNFGLDSRDT